MDPRDRPNPSTDALLDLLRGELDPAQAEALSARVAADPALRAERDRLAAFLSRAAAAHDLPLDAGDASRVAARIRHRVQREDARPVRAVPSRFQWPRILAIAVGAHVVVLGLLAFFVPGQKTKSQGDGTIVVRTPEYPWPTPGDPEDDRRPDPSLAVGESMPIEDLLRDLPDASMADGLLALGPTDLGTGGGTALPAFARAGLVRSDAEAKYAILARVGERSDLAQVEDSLRTLARRQAEDGSFASAAKGATPASPSVRVTATVLLAFLGDGHTSRSGGHREVVAKGIGWLRQRVSDATSLEDRAIALAALTEDYAFSSGEMTPAEARVRAEELRTLVARTAAQARDTAASSPWVALALDAGARAGVAFPAGDRTWAVAYAALPHTAAAEPRTAVLEGTALLLARKAEVFRAWNRRASTELKARLRSGTADVEEVALIVLALEVPYRTY